MNYTLNYTEDWSINDIKIILSNPLGNNILTKVKPDPELSNITIRYNFINLIKDYIKFIDSLIIEADILFSLPLPQTHLYDSSIGIIFHFNVVKQFIKKFTNIIKTHKTFNKRIGIISAGTSDLPLVAIGCVLLILGDLNVIPYYDYGVDSIVRTKSILNELKSNKLNIVIAGMENALSHIISNNVNKPIICVPSSCGYGYGKGESAILSLLQANSGMIIFNNDNIYGACVLAEQMIGIKNVTFVKSFDLSNICEFSVAENNMVIVDDELGVTTNIIAGIIKNNKLFVPVIGLANNNTVKIMLNGCVPYGVVMNNKININKLISKL